MTEPHPDDIPIPAGLLDQFDDPELREAMRLLITEGYIAYEHDGTEWVFTSIKPYREETDPLA